MQIYIHKNNQQLGPFSVDEIKAQLSAGTLSLQDPAWWDGQTSWVSLGQSPLAASLTPGVPAVPIPITGISPIMPPSGETTSGLAIAALILSIAGLPFILLCYLVSPLFFLPALICGHVALYQIKRTPNLGGRGMAIASLVLGYLQLCILPLAIIILIAFGNQVKETFKTINAQLNSAQHESINSTNSDNNP